MPTKHYSAYVGVLHANDNLDDGSNHESNQLTLGGKVLTLYERLTLTMDHAQSIGSNDNTDFPTRTILGAEYNGDQKSDPAGRSGIYLGFRRQHAEHPNGHAFIALEGS